MTENPGLLSNVASSYRSRFVAENLISQKLFENYVIQGKKRKHTVDIYLEFIQMNNRETTIMKTISDREITENDIWEFYTVLQDLKFKAKGIIYYENGKVSSLLNEQANSCNIELKKFYFMNAVAESVLKTLEIMLPDDKVIGDPFWILMETFEDNGIRKTNGNYVQIEDSIPLFLSREQAKQICETRNRVTNIRSQVFGLSQNQMKALCKKLEVKGYPVGLGIILPKFEQPADGQLAIYKVDPKKLLKYYYREN